MTPATQQTKLTPLTALKPRALEVMAARLNVDPAKMLDTLKATVFKNATNEELLALVVVANEYDLSPFLKEIYAFPAKGGGICPVVSVDGWNKMLIRQDNFDGIEFDMSEGDDGLPFSCTATIYIKGRSKPVKITEYYAECARSTDPWKTMPRRMLRHKALIQGARVAFGFSGVHDEDEAIDIKVSAMREPPRQIAALGDGQVPVENGVKSDSNPTTDLSELVVSSGYDFDTFVQWGKASGMLDNGLIEKMTRFDDVPTDKAKTLLRAKTGLLDGLRRIKEGLAT